MRKLRSILAGSNLGLVYDSDSVAFRTSNPGGGANVSLVSLVGSALPGEFNGPPQRSPLFEV
jgi:hypothetical protein